MAPATADTQNRFTSSSGVPSGAKRPPGSCLPLSAVPSPPTRTVRWKKSHKTMSRWPRGDAHRDQVGRARGGERHRVDRPARPARPLHGPQEHQGGERREEHRERVRPCLLREAGNARDHGEDKPARQPGETAAEPPPDERDHRGGGGHRDDRRQAHGRRGLAEHRHPQVQPEVVDAEHRVDVVQHGPQLRQGAARGRPARELVAPQLRHADLEQAERGGHHGGHGPGHGRPPRDRREAPARARTRLTRGGRLSGSRRSDPTARDLQPPPGVAVFVVSHAGFHARMRGGCDDGGPWRALRTVIDDAEVESNDDG